MCYNNIIVPTACFGVVGCSEDWLCVRCSLGASNAECSLCLLRGGALKQTDGGQWAHLVCAVTIPEVTLADPHKKEPVVTEKVTRSRRKLVRIIILLTPCYVHSLYHLYAALQPLYVCVWEQHITRSRCVCTVYQI